MKKKVYVGRQTLKCANEACGKDFSTHSSNRTVCHKCKPKCRDIHYFDKKKVETVVTETK